MHPFSNFQRVGRFSLLALPLLAMNAVSPETASADSIALATEVMMEDSASNNLIVSSLFQPSVGSTLTYSTTMGTDGDSYTYTSNGGSLGGMPTSGIYLTGGGTSSPGSGIWHTYESGYYNGSLYWTVIDTETITMQMDGSYKIVSDYNYYDPNNNKLGDLHLEVLVNAAITMDTDTGYFTDVNGNYVPMSDFTSTSYLRPDGTWCIEVLPVYPSNPSLPDEYVGTGYTPTAGGPGYFTAEFVPEPSSWIMLSLGSLGFLGLERRRRRAERARMNPAPDRE